MHALWLKLCGPSSRIGGYALLPLGFLKNHCLGYTRWHHQYYISNRFASVELVSSRSPVGVSSFTDRGGSLVVSTGKILQGGAACPAVSRSVVSCAGPLLQAGTGIVSSSRESLEHVRLDDQISEPLFGQAAADTESMEESTKY